MRTVVDLCVQNFEKKNELEGELEEAWEILRQTLCTDCKTNLKNKGSKKAIKSKSSTLGGITIKGKGNAFILSLLAVSVALVGFIGMNSNLTNNQILDSP
jgi:hypothetical protein